MIQGMAIDANPTKMRKDGIIKDRDVEWLTKDVQIQNYYESSPMCGQPFTVAANKDMFVWLNYVNNKKNIAKSDRFVKMLFVSGANDALGGYGADIKKLVALFQSLGYPEHRSSHLRQRPPRDLKRNRQPNRLSGHSRNSSN
ncbi:MAG: hypothetical protein MZU97_25115 [Bacillus subtilis]|nr:hypothetical protein [Bacillus subtilis]